MVAGLGGAAAATLCASSTFWAGPVSAAMDGLNLAIPVGVLGSAALYWALSRAFGTFAPTPSPTSARH